MFGEVRFQQRLEPGEQVRFGHGRRVRCDRRRVPRREPKQGARQTAQQQCSCRTAASEFTGDPSHQQPCVIRHGHHKGMPQRAPHVANATQNLVQQLGGQRGYPALGATLKREGMYIARRHIYQRHRQQRVGTVIDLHRAAPCGQQQQLMQAIMPVGCQLPVVQGGAGGNGFAVQDVRQVRRFPEQVEVENVPVAR